jgi:RimJ/RimL family protein N-acetyltransferase
MKYLISKTIETPRLVMRQFQTDDLTQLSKILSDKHITKYIDNGNTLNFFECWHHIAMLLGHWSLNGYGSYAIVEKKSNLLIGKVGLYHPKPWPGVELKWIISHEHQRNGFAFESSNAVIKEAFQKNISDEIICLIHKENEASINLAKKLKMKQKNYDKPLPNHIAVYNIEQTEYS